MRGGKRIGALLDGIAAYLEDPAQEVPADAPVIAKAMELGAMRHAQSFDEYEILKEFELLGGVVYAFCVREVRTMDEAAYPCAKDELLVCGHRLFRAVAVIQQAAVAHYLQHVRARLTEREGWLRGFNRALTHELRNQIGAVLGAADLLELPELAEADRAPVVAIVRRHAAAMRAALENLVELSRLDADARQQRRILLPQAVAEAARQLRDAAQAAGVAVRLGHLPGVEVPAAAVELAVTNYLSNAIKYADPARPTRWVEVHGHVTELRAGPAETVVEVWDNGLGEPEEKRAGLFGRGFRAHAETVTGIEGMGLGLSIVRDAVEAIGGRVWATFPPGGGSCFALALPARRARDVPNGHGSNGRVPNAESAPGESMPGEAPSGVRDVRPDPARPRSGSAPVRGA